MSTAGPHTVSWAPPFCLQYTSLGSLCRCGAWKKEKQVSGHGKEAGPGTWLGLRALRVGEQALWAPGVSQPWESTPALTCFVLRPCPSLS